MKLSTVFELLLIFLIIAFAASKVIDPKSGTKWKTLLEKSVDKELRKHRQATPNRYCSCSNLTCNCCRDFSLPAVPALNGPGCASLKYLQGDSMQVTMSFGERVLRNVTISGKKPKPICMGLPGGISKFCGRVYGISRDGENLRACLGLELRAQEDVEAALRVSCFKLGPKGLNLEPGKPVPTDEGDDDDDDEDDDDFGFPGDEEDDDDEDDDDDDDDDDDVFGLEDDDDNESENAVESGEGDYAGFSALSDEFLESFFESDSANKKKKPSAAAANKPQAVTVKTTSFTTLSNKKAKPQKVVANKLVTSTPTKTTERVSINSYNVSEKVQAVPVAGLVSTIPSPSQKFASNDKVYVSPSQYKPTEKIRLTPNQPLESYLPTILQLSTERVYTSPQQMSTDKIYISTINQQANTENYASGSTIEDKEQPTINYYIPTTQQFPSTEKVYMPLNLSSADSLEYEPITSTSMTINVVQSIQEVPPKNSTTTDVRNSVSPAIENVAADTTPDSEYNEVDSNTKTTINDIRFNEINTANSIIPLKIGKPMTSAPTTATTITTASTSPFATKKKTTTERAKQEEDEEEDDDESAFEEVVDTAASVFEMDNTKSTKNNSKIGIITSEINLEDGLDDGSEDEDSDEDGIILSNNENTNSDYVGIEKEDGDTDVKHKNDADDDDNDDDDEDDDDDDDDNGFRKFGIHTKKTMNVTSAPSSTPVVAMHSGREHKRMNLPPLFSQNPEISSFWNSGGHLYKIRMSPMVQEPFAALQNPNRLGKLNLFVPAVESNPVSNVFGSQTQSSHSASAHANLPHRFNFPDAKNRTSNRSNRNHKRMKIPDIHSSISS